MTYMQWVSRQPELGDEIVAKAKRVEALRQEAADLEDEVCRLVNARWSDAEVAKAKSGR